MIRLDRASIAQGGQLVVEMVSLHMRAGEAWALIGRSGAGKSMLLAAAATAVPLHAGDILVDGHSVRRAAEAVRMAAGYAADRMPPWPGIRAGEWLELFGVAAGRRGKSLTLAVEKGLTLARLGGRDRDLVDSLDAGRAKWLLLAKALLHDPQVLLLDDPFGGLDPAGGRELERLILDAHLMGRTVLAAIDDASVPDCFTHLAVLAEGRLIAAGTNDPATFAEGRRWRFLVRCPGRSEDVVRVLQPLDTDPHRIDADAVVARIDLSSLAPSDVVAAIVRAGIPLDSATYDPPWQAQLIDDEKLLD
jgi:ABC-2 type transport system ATP-binding protein